ncbi:glycosyltransferase [Enterococcus asini]|uniref:glycosyltransferase n=1 Tax=Enterococcus asini TaxID=57732 RepID=UPI00288E19BB|nr:glycosyltransferase [Enterococcus asini]MDT2764687.1 glycosyltransferase [Enterococcus asini]
MKILVNDIAASTGGAISILQDLYDDILKNDSDNEWCFMLSNEYVQAKNNVNILLFEKEKKYRIIRTLFDYIYGRIIVNKLKPDVYVTLQNTATLGVKAKQIVYLHQTLPFQFEKNFSFFRTKERKSAFYQHVIGFFIKDTLKRSKTTVFVQSNWLKATLKKEMNNKIIVVPPKVKPVNNDFDYNSRNKTFFYPGTHIIYKNHEIIFDAVDELVHRGYKNFKVVLTIDKPQELNSNLQIYEFLGNISRENVIQHYRSSVLIFPSYIESYGLPLKEAQMTKSLIFASNTSFSNEILKTYPNAYFFSPFQKDELVNLMQKQIDGKIEYNKIDLDEDISEGESLFSSIIDIANKK